MKPENILLDQGGHICLIDFGLSIELDENQEFAESFVGTPLYLAPEQIVSNGKINYKADIFGVGATFYFLLHGRTPFEGQNISSIFYNIENCDIEIKDGLDDLVEDFLKQTLEKNVDKRLNHMSSHPIFEKVNWNRIKMKKNNIINLEPRVRLESCLGFGTGDHDYSEKNYPNKKIANWSYNQID